jgi:hypothetical protein
VVPAPIPDPPSPESSEPESPKADSPATKVRTSAACEEARAGMRAFVAGPAPAGPPPAWRTHMSACSACTFAYHELVQEAARLARGATRVAGRTTEKYYEERARRSLIANDVGRGSRLPRLFLPVSVVGLVVLIFTQSAPNKIQLRALAGTVTRGQVALATDAGVEVQRGDGCSTGAGARAVLARGEDRVTFGPDSSFFVDRTDRMSLRFFAGEAHAEGNVNLILPMGAVEVRAGAALVTFKDGAAVITCEKGDVTRTEATGRHIVAPGETQRIEPPAAADAAH